MNLPKPDCELGYTQSQVVDIMGDRLSDFHLWMHGATMAICAGLRYNHELKAYMEDVCHDHPHGAITYETDVRQFLQGLPNTD